MIMVRILIAVFAFLPLLGCASICGESSAYCQLRSEPSGVDVSIKNEKGLEVFRGKTPTTVLLKKKTGYFNGADYYITAKHDGYAERVVSIDRGMSWWYAGNIIFGGLIGFLIVDPATGSMWTIDENPPMIILHPMPVQRASKE